jgi:hypothetical protein
MSMRECQTELLLLWDGRVLIHNLTPEMAALLSQIAPMDSAMHQKAAQSWKCLKRSILDPRTRTDSPTENRNS